MTCPDCGAIAHVVSTWGRPGLVLVFLTPAVITSYECPECGTYFEEVA